MRKTILIVSIFALSMLLLTACQASGGEVADDSTLASCAKMGDFGTRLTEFGQELTQFDSPEAATADEGLNQAMANMDQAMEEFKASAPTEMNQDKLEEAADELEQSFRNATEGMSRKEMSAAVFETFDLFNRECNVANFGRPG